MSIPRTLNPNEWSHRCLRCQKRFQSVELDLPCPKCGNREHRRTKALHWYLDEQYGAMTPEEWSTTLGIEDLTNPVDESVPRKSDRTVKNYTHVFADPGFREQFLREPEFAARCYEKAAELFQILRLEMRRLEHRPKCAFTSFEWDLFECMWAFVTGIEAMDEPIEIASRREVVELFVLARRLSLVGMASKLGRKKLRTLFGRIYQHCSGDQS